MRALARCLACASALLVELSALLVMLLVGSAMSAERMLGKVHAVRSRLTALALRGQSSVLGYILLLLPPFGMTALPEPGRRPRGKAGGAIVLLPPPNPEMAHALAVALAAKAPGETIATLPTPDSWGVRTLLHDVFMRLFPTPRLGNTVLVVAPDQDSLRTLIPRWAQVQAAHNRTRTSPSPPFKGLVGVSDLLKGWRIGEASSLKSDRSERSERSDSSPSPPRRQIGRVIPLLCTEKGEKDEYVRTLVGEYCASNSLALRGVVLLPPARAEDIQVARRLVATFDSRLVQLVPIGQRGTYGATKIFCNDQMCPPLDVLVQQTASAVTEHWEDWCAAAQDAILNTNHLGAKGLLQTSISLLQDLAHFLIGAGELALYPPGLLRPISTPADESDSSEGESWGKHTQPPLPEKAGVSDALLQLVREALYAPCPRDEYYLGWGTRWSTWIRK